MLVPHMKKVHITFIFLREIEQKYLQSQEFSIAWGNIAKYVLKFLSCGDDL
jgi:hypothetical protein